MKKSFLITLALIFSVVAFAAPLMKSVTWDNIRRHPAPLPVIGTLEPVRSALSNPSWWSVGSETLDRDYAVFDNYIQYMGETGVGYARLQSGWAKSEPKKGKYNFAWIDHQVDGLLEQGIHPWICLCYGNPLYTDNGINLNARLFGDGPVMDAWLKYVREVVRRYKGKVTMYEVWNEPDGAKSADGKMYTNWDEYALLFVRTAKVIREEDPDVKIAAFGAYSLTKDYFVKGLERIKELGGTELVDYVTYHAYWPNPDTIRQSVQKLANDCKEFNPSVCLLQGESGCPAQLEYRHALPNKEWTEYSQAKWDLRHMLVNFSMGIPSSVFTMVDLDYGWMQQSFGLIRTNGIGEPVYKRPKFYAIQHITSIVRGDVRPVEKIDITNVSTSNPISKVGIERNGKTIGYFMWFSGSEPNSSLSKELINLTVWGADIANPVYVDMVSGYVHDISRNCQKLQGDGIKYIGLPLWDAPILVIDRSEINFK